MNHRKLTFEACEPRELLASMATIELDDGIEIPADEAEVTDVAEAMAEKVALFQQRALKSLVDARFRAGRLIREFQDRVHADFYTNIAKVAAVIDPGTNDIIRAGFDDPGFAANADGDLETGDLTTGLTAAYKMNDLIARAIRASGAADDGDISPEDLFSVNAVLQKRYLITDANGDPIRVDGDGTIQERDPNLTDVYYVGRWGNLHGDDADGRLEYGFTGDAVEHGYHLIQNDGGTTTLDGTPGDYTLNPDGGDGENLWTTIADGIYHAAFDIVYENEDGDLEFADEYVAGVDYYFLNEDGDRNASLQDVSDWLDYFMEEDLEAMALESPMRLRKEVRSVALSSVDWVALEPPEPPKREHAGHAGLTSHALASGHYDRLH